jgi:hypothetical protein
MLNSGLAPARVIKIHGLVKRFEMIDAGLRQQLEVLLHKQRIRRGCSARISATRSSHIGYSDKAALSERDVVDIQRAQIAPRTRAEACLARLGRRDSEPPNVRAASQ